MPGFAAAASNELGPSIVMTDLDVFSVDIGLRCSFLFKIAWGRIVPLFAEGDVEQDGMSSVTPDCAPPAASKGLPLAVIMVAGVAGKSAPGRSLIRTCGC